MAIILRSTGATKDTETLDVPQQQILMAVDALPGGCKWEHHVLLEQIVGTCWVTLDSSRFLAVDDLAKEEILTLGESRSSQWSTGPFWFSA